MLDLGRVFATATISGQFSFSTVRRKSLNRAEELRAAAAIHRVPLNRDGQISRQPLALSLSVPAKIQAGSNTS